MIRCGSPPFLECSSRGDKRFSAFYARPESLNGRSIEEAFQGMKEIGSWPGVVVTGLSWREAKGKPSLNHHACAAAYRRWWKEWVKEQGLLPVLREASGLSDMFGQPGHVCQAAVLWEIRNE